jgi:hypothetical protein
MKLITAILGLALVAGCALPGFSELRGGAEPDVDVPPELQPTGPIVELGRGEMLGTHWRFVTFESRMGSCTSLETAGGSGGGTSCGGGLGTLPPGQVVSLASMGSGTGIPTIIEGAAAGDVAAVVVETRGGDRFPATLMSLAPVAREGQVFVVVLPGDRAPRRIVAFDAAGDELGHEEVPGP